MGFDIQKEVPREESIGDQPDKSFESYFNM